MTTRYRNEGAPFLADSGERIGRGDVFTPSETDLLRRAYKLRPAGAFEAAEAEPAVPNWPLKTPEPAYLERNPEGPHADLARQRIAAGLAD